MVGERVREGYEKTDILARWDGRLPLVLTIAHLLSPMRSVAGLSPDSRCAMLWWIVCMERKNVATASATRYRRLPSRE